MTLSSVRFAHLARAALHSKKDALSIYVAVGQHPRFRQLDGSAIENRHGALERAGRGASPAVGPFFASKSPLNGITSSQVLKDKRRVAPPPVLGVVSPFLLVRLAPCSFVKSLHGAFSLSGTWRMLT